MNPTILLIARDAAETLAGEFGRYERDYDVVVVDSLADALRHTQRVQSYGGQLALVGSELTCADTPGLVALDCIHALCPTVKRVLLIGWGEFAGSRDQVREAMAAGRLDAPLSRSSHRPGRPPSRASASSLTARGSVTYVGTRQRGRGRPACHAGAERGGHRAAVPGALLQLQRISDQPVH